MLRLNCDQHEGAGEADHAAQLSGYGVDHGISLVPSNIERLNGSHNTIGTPNCRDGQIQCRVFHPALKHPIAEHTFAHSS